MDVMTPEQRRKAMASNRGRTRPERALATALWRRGLRYLTHDGYLRVYARKLAGQPDIIFPKRRVLIFVDGCFWHGCPECRRVPADMAPEWLTKIRGNIERDQRNTASLEAAGWSVVRIPEHRLKTKSKLEETADDLANQLVGQPE